MGSPRKGVKSKRRSLGPSLEVGQYKRKNFKGDKIKVDRGVRGEPKECNVPEAKKEGSAARR